MSETVLARLGAPGDQGYHGRYGEQGNQDFPGSLGIEGEDALAACRRAEQSAGDADECQLPQDEPLRAKLSMAAPVPIAL